MHQLTRTELVLPVGPAFQGVISLRAAGDMRQPAPLRELLGRLGVAPGDLRRVRQVHSRQVVTAGSCRRLGPPARCARVVPAETGWREAHDGAAAGDSPSLAAAGGAGGAGAGLAAAPSGDGPHWAARADTPGLWAAVPADGVVAGPADAARGVTLMVTVADCLPLMLAAPEGGYALVHSGWRGTGIAAAAVRALGQRFGAAPAALKAVVGPGIGACCYHVDEARYRLFRSRYGPGAVRTAAGRRYLDLRAANVTLLRRLGVRDIEVVAECTSCSPRLHSSRRDGGGAACRLMAAFLRPARRGHG